MHPDYCGGRDTKTEGRIKSEYVFTFSACEYGKNICLVVSGYSVADAMESINKNWYPNIFDMCFSFTVRTVTGSSR